MLRHLLVLLLLIPACGSEPDPVPEITVDAADDDTTERRRRPRDRSGQDDDPELGTPDDPMVGTDPDPDPDPEPDRERDPEPEPEPEPWELMQPSNMAEFGGFELTGIVVGPPNGAFDTDAQCTSDSVMGDCRPVDGTDATPDACVCRVDEITIEDLHLVGDRALVVMASRTIRITGTLDVSAVGAQPGPGAFRPTTSAGGRSGGAGGSFGAHGGGFALDPFGTEDLLPLLGGFAGEDSCGARPGGGGGGAVQLSAAETVVVEGQILANGGGGTGGGSGSYCNGGAGGGSGGAVLIEAATVEVAGGVAANGGGGGSGGTTDFSGYRGADGRAGIDQAPGGAAVRDEPCLLYSDVISGYGGGGGTRDVGAQSGGLGGDETRCIGNTYSGDGGGGGSVGRIRINTTRGAQSCLCNGTMSPAPTFGEVVL